MHLSLVLSVLFLCTCGLSRGALPPTSAQLDQAQQTLGQRRREFDEAYAAFSRRVLTNSEMMDAQKQFDDAGDRFIRARSSGTEAEKEAARQALTRARAHLSEVSKRLETTDPALQLAGERETAAALEVARLRRLMQPASAPQTPTTTTSPSQGPETTRASPSPTTQGSRADE